MNRIYLLLLLMLPSIGWAQTQSKQSLGLQIINLGLAINYEHLIADNHSLALVYGRDVQYAGESRLHQGNIFRLQYRFRFGKRLEESQLRSGLIASTFVEHATNRLLKRDFQRVDFSAAAIGAMLGYRFFVGKRKRIGYEVLLGPKYRISYFAVPEWYVVEGGGFPMRGLGFTGSVGILFLLDHKQKSS